MPAIFRLLLKRRNFCVSTTMYIYLKLYKHIPTLSFSSHTQILCTKAEGEQPAPAHPHWPRDAAASQYVQRWKFLIPGIMLHYGRNCCASACFTSGLRDCTRRGNAFQHLDDVSSVHRTLSIIAISVW